MAEHLVSLQCRMIPGTSSQIIGRAWRVRSTFGLRSSTVEPKHERHVSDYISDIEMHLMLRFGVCLL